MDKLSPNLFAAQICSFFSLPLKGSSLKEGRRAIKKSLMQPKRTHSIGNDEGLKYRGSYTNIYPPVQRFGEIGKHY